MTTDSYKLRAVKELSRLIALVIGGAAAVEQFDLDMARMDALSDEETEAEIRAQFQNYLKKDRI